MNALESNIQQFFGIDNAGESRLVADLFQPETLAKNDFFLKANRNCDKLSFVETGMIRVFFEMPEKEVTQWICPPGYFLTDLSAFLFRTHTRCHMQAITDCTMYTIRHQDYLTLTRIIPRWNEMEKLFICQCFITMENRISSLISLSSEERYHLLFSQQPELFNMVPLQYIASMLGMTPETFSRIRAKKIAGA